MRSALCFQLFVVGDDLGALNIVARHPRAFTDESERIGLLFASHASVALAQAQKINSLELGMVSRDLIGQAKGVLMERYKITADQAFTLLATVSQDTTQASLLYCFNPDRRAEDGAIVRYTGKEESRDDNSRAKIVSPAG